MEAATVSSPWGKPGAWALDAEEHEDELRQQQLESPKDNNTSGEAEFPSLAAAATKQPKKKKNQTLSLAEFATYGSRKSLSQPTQPSRGLTHEDLLNLPTGPRQRSAEELDRSRLGGGFKSYGMNNRNADDSSSSRWGGGNSRVSSRDRDSNREFAPSRADEIDDWSKTKKSPVGNGHERRERSSFFDSQSKADELDSWLSNKQTETRRFGTANVGFERRGSFDSLSRDRYGSSGGGASDSDNWGRKKEDNNGTGSARPKLVLQPRTLPVDNGNGTAAKPKGSNPFGDARPREEVLAEKGQEWKQIDEKLDSSKINKNNKEMEKSERDNSSFGRRSFGNGHGGSVNYRFESSWRKPDVAVTESRPDSADRTENGHESENGHATEGEVTRGN